MALIQDIQDDRNPITDSRIEVPNMKGSEVPDPEATPTPTPTRVTELPPEVEPLAPTEEPVLDPVASTPQDKAAQILNADIIPATQYHEPPENFLENAGPHDPQKVNELVQLGVSSAYRGYRDQVIRQRQWQNQVAMPQFPTELYRPDLHGKPPIPTNPGADQIFTTEDDGLTDSMFSELSSLITNGGISNTSTLSQEGSDGQSTLGHRPGNLSSLANVTERQAAQSPVVSDVDEMYDATDRTWAETVFGFIPRLFAGRGEDKPARPEPDNVIEDMAWRADVVLPQVMALPSVLGGALNRGLGHLLVNAPVIGDALVPPEQKEEFLNDVFFNTTRNLAAFTTLGLATERRAGNQSSPLEMLLTDLSPEPGQAEFAPMRGSFGEAGRGVGGAAIYALQTPDDAVRAFGQDLYELLFESRARIPSRSPQAERNLENEAPLGFNHLAQALTGTEHSFMAPRRSDNRGMGWTPIVEGQVGINLPGGTDETVLGWLPGSGTATGFVLDLASELGVGALLDGITSTVKKAVPTRPTTTAITRSLVPTEEGGAIVRVLRDDTGNVVTPTRALPPARAENIVSLEEFRRIAPAQEVRQEVGGSLAPINRQTVSDAVEVIHHNMDAEVVGQQRRLTMVELEDLDAQRQLTMDDVLASHNRQRQPINIGTHDNPTLADSIREMVAQSPIRKLDPVQAADEGVTTVDVSAVTVEDLGSYTPVSVRRQLPAAQDTIGQRPRTLEEQIAPQLPDPEARPLQVEGDDTTPSPSPEPVSEDSTIPDAATNTVDGEEYVPVEGDFQPGPEMQEVVSGYRRLNQDGWEVFKSEDGRVVAEMFTPNFAPNSQALEIGFGIDDSSLASGRKGPIPRQDLGRMFRELRTLLNTHGRRIPFVAGVEVAEEAASFQAKAKMYERHGFLPVYREDYAFYLDGEFSLSEITPIPIDEALQDSLNFGSDQIYMIYFPDRNTRAGAAPAPVRAESDVPTTRVEPEPDTPTEVDVPPTRGGVVELGEVTEVIEDWGDGQSIKRYGDYIVREGSAETDQSFELLKQKGLEDIGPEFIGLDDTGNVVYRHVEGESLIDVLDEELVEQSTIDSIVETINRMEEANIAHGNLTPEAMVLEPDGSVRIVDVGIMFENPVPKTDRTTFLDFVVDNEDLHRRFVDAFEKSEEGLVLREKIPQLDALRETLQDAALDDDMLRNAIFEVKAETDFLVYPIGKASLDEMKVEANRLLTKYDNALNVDNAIEQADSTTTPLTGRSAEMYQELETALQNERPVDRSITVFDDSGVEAYITRSTNSDSTLVASFNVDGSLYANTPATPAVRGAIRRMAKQWKQDVRPLLDFKIQEGFETIATAAAKSRAELLMKWKSYQRYGFYLTNIEQFTKFLADHPNGFGIDDVRLVDYNTVSVSGDITPYSNRLLVYAGDRKLPIYAEGSDNVVGYTKPSSKTTSRVSYYLGTKEGQAGGTPSLVSPTSPTGNGYDLLPTREEARVLAETALAPDTLQSGPVNQVGRVYEVQYVPDKILDMDSPVPPNIQKTIDNYLEETYSPQMSQMTDAGLWDITQAGSVSDMLDEFDQIMRDTNPSSAPVESQGFRNVLDEAILEEGFDTKQRGKVITPLKHVEVLGTGEAVGTGSRFEQVAAAQEATNIYNDPATKADAAKHRLEAYDIAEDALAQQLWEQDQILEGIIDSQVDAAWKLDEDLADFDARAAKDAADAFTDDDLLDLMDFSNVDNDLEYGAWNCL